MVALFKSYRFLVFFKVLVVIPLSNLLMLALYSYLFGWNGWTLFFFWFFLTPIMTIWNARKISPAHQIERAIMGMICFYGLLVFMIYKHYQSDYFQIMMVSMVYNLFVMTVVMWSEKGR